MSAAKKPQIQVGDVAPDFELPDQWGKPVRLRELLGRSTIVLYFYPKDETPGCVLEARTFRDSYDSFTEQGAEVIGVSSDSVKSHRRFVTRYHLPFILLSDRDGAVRELYGVEKTLGLLPGRVTFVIDRTGIVRHVYASQLLAMRHSSEALAALETLNDGSSGTKRA